MPTAEIEKAETSTALALPGLQKTRQRFSASVVKSLAAVEEMERDMAPREDADGKLISFGTMDMLNLVRSKALLMDMALKLNGDKHPEGKMPKGEGLQISNALANILPHSVISQSRVTEKDANGKVTGSRIEEKLSHTVASD